MEFEDYTILDSTLTILSGNTNATADSFRTLDDDNLELTENFTVQIDTEASLGVYFIFGDSLTIEIAETENIGEPLPISLSPLPPSLLISISGILAIDRLIAWLM